MTTPMDDSKTDDLQDSKTEELLKTADAEITRKTSRKELLSNSNSDLIAKPLDALERGDTTVGDLSSSDVLAAKADGQDENHKNSPSEFSSEMSEHSSILNDHGNSTLDTGSTYTAKSNGSRDQQKLEVSPKRGRKPSALSPARQKGRKGAFTRAGMLGLISSDDESAEITTPAAPTPKRGRRRESLGAYKVPYANKPKTGGGFVIVKKRHQSRRASGVMQRPARFSVQTDPGPSLVDSESSSMDVVDPPPLDMTTSMNLALDQLRKEQEEREQERKRNQVEPKGWLYLTALCTLLFSTMGLLVIVMYIFGAAFGNVYHEARDQLEYLSMPGVLDDESTPQHAALEWLVNDDGANGQDLVEGTARLEARYSLAVLYYSTEGETRWLYNLNFLSHEHECDWNEEVEIDNDAGGKKKATIGVICDEFQNVVELSMIGNNLRGELPMELKALSGLVSLSFKGNDLSGTIPDWKWDDLESLDLQKNEFEGSIPTSVWTEYSSLKYLDLSHNKLSSSLPPAMSELSRIESINLGYNELSGTITLFPNDLMEYEDGANNTARTLGIPTLRTFNVTNNKMGGTLDFLELFPSLEVLDVTHNSLTGRIPGVLGGLSRLETLYLSDNEFFGAIPTTIGSLKNLTTIVASNNALNRQFPWGSFDASNTLTELIFSGNSLTGSLPKEMGTFTSLEVLDFGHNLLSGRIDPSIARDISLRILRLSRNQLEGPLPSEPEALPKTLEIIDLHSNRFSGELPASWASLSSLNVLTLHDNLFLGPIPEDWIQMSSLERLTLHLNGLKGSVDFMCFKQPQPAITANCAGVEPMVNCSCCILCLE